MTKYRPVSLCSGSEGDEDDNDDEDLNEMKAKEVKCT